jgi:hypothetical protein
MQSRSGAPGKQGTSSSLTLVIGSDWTSGTTFPGGTSASASADTGAPLADSHAQTADQSKTCAKVSPYKTVQINGVAMTPAQAYAAASSTKDSAS